VLLNWFLDSFRISLDSIIFVSNISLARKKVNNNLTQFESTDDVFHDDANDIRVRGCM
jgi:hypothetical protein